jgi:hypothetical protein
MTTALTILLDGVSIVIAASLLRGAINKHRAGDLLLDVGRNPGNRRNIASGFLGLLFLAGGLAGMWREFTMLHLAHATLGATCLIALIANAIGRFQVCTNGLWLYCDLIPWDQIVSHAWTEHEACSLQLQIRPLPFVKRDPRPFPPLPVPKELKTAVEQAIQAGKEMP